MMTKTQNTNWPAERVAEARAIMADVVHHSDHLIRIACNVLVQHGETAQEREDARILLVVVDARQPIRNAPHCDRDMRGVR
ncbi:hypothetical protein [Roseinatronobacter sp.]|uniref:hypothetical protein n=1 Tax=Roseinatronobacter sp. TaxID=1945755 RepID=UPI0025EF2780|nr:hypothetical protein [Roseibaca sp.]